MGTARALSIVGSPVWDESHRAFRVVFTWRTDNNVDIKDQWIDIATSSDFDNDLYDNQQIALPSAAWHNSFPNVTFIDYTATFYLPPNTAFKWRITQYWETFIFGNFWDASPIASLNTPVHITPPDTGGGGTAGPATQLTPFVQSVQPDGSVLIRLLWANGHADGGAAISQIWVDVGQNAAMPDGSYFSRPVDTGQSQIVIQHLEPGTQYYWRVTYLVDWADGSSDWISSQVAGFLTSGTSHVPGTGGPCEPPSAAFVGVFGAGAFVVQDDGLASLPNVGEIFTQVNGTTDAVLLDLYADSGPIVTGYRFEGPFPASASIRFDFNGMPWNQTIAYRVYSVCGGFISLPKVSRSFQTPNAPFGPSGLGVQAGQFNSATGKFEFSIIWTRGGGPQGVLDQYIDLSLTPGFETPIPIQRGTNESQAAISILPGRLFYIRVSNRLGPDFWLVSNTQSVRYDGPGNIGIAKHPGDLIRANGVQFQYKGPSTTLRITLGMRSKGGVIVLEGSKVVNVVQGANYYTLAAMDIGSSSAIPGNMPQGLYDAVISIVDTVQNFMVDGGQAVFTDVWNVLPVGGSF